MKDEIINATGKGGFTNVSSTAKGALQAAQTQDLLIRAKTEIHSLVTAKTISIQDNMHLLLGTVNPTPNPQSNGSAVPTAYYNFDTLQILVKQL